MRSGAASQKKQIQPAILLPLVFREDFVSTYSKLFPWCGYDSRQSIVIHSPRFTSASFLNPLTMPFILLVNSWSPTQEGCKFDENPQCLFGLYSQVK